MRDRYHTSGGCQIVWTLLWNDNNGMEVHASATDGGDTDVRATDGGDVAAPVRRPNGTDISVTDGGDVTTVGGEDTGVIRDRHWRDA